MMAQPPNMAQRHQEKTDRQRERERERGGEGGDRSKTGNRR